MATHTTNVPEASLTTTVYTPGGKVYSYSSIPYLNNTATTYAISSDVDLSSRSSIPSVSLSSTPTAPLTYLSQAASNCLNAWVYINGVDVSSYQFGEITIMEKERSSTIANFSLVFGPTIQNGDAVLIVVDDGNNTKSLFVGELLEQKPSPDKGEIICTASTNLQGQVRDMTKEQIKAFINGFYHVEINRTEGDNWEYAQELLESVPADIHIGHDGSLVRADWEAKATADVQITNATRFADSLRGDIAQLGNIVNRNRVTVQHQCTRRKLRTVGCSWTLPIEWTPQKYLTESWPLPTQEAVKSALDASGWEHRFIDFTPPWHTYESPTEYAYVDPTGGGFVQKFEKDLVIGFSAKLSVTWNQRVINNYVYDVKSSASIAAIGERGVEEQWGIAEQIEEVEEERKDGSGAIYGKGSGVDGATVVNGAWGASNAVELEGGQLLSNGDWYWDNINADTDLEQGKNTAVNRAITEILSSHRQHSETFEVPFSHGNLLSNTTRLVGDLTCKGKNRALTHKINPSKGYATTILEVAISGLEGQGSDTPDPLEDSIAPVNDPLGSSNDITLDTLIGGTLTTPPKADKVSAVYSDYEHVVDWTPGESELEIYGRGVTVITPDISDADVDDREQDINQTVIVDVPIDEYTLLFTGNC